MKTSMKVIVSIPKQRHGNHTWDLILFYHRCPSCGYIIENREPFEQRLHSVEKEIVCPKCAGHFIVTKTKPPTFGPLLGHDPEINN